MSNSNINFKTYSVCVCVFFLCVSTGCNARIIPEEKGQWEVMVEQFNNYFTEVNLKAGEVVKDIKSSQISRELE